MSVFQGLSNPALLQRETSCLSLARLFTIQTSLRRQSKKSSHCLFARCAETQKNYGKSISQQFLPFVSTPSESWGNFHEFYEIHAPLHWSLAIRQSLGSTV